MVVDIDDDPSERDRAANVVVRIGIPPLPDSSQESAGIFKAVRGGWPFIARLDRENRQSGECVLSRFRREVSILL